MKSFLLSSGKKQISALTTLLQYNAGSFIQCTKARKGNNDTEIRKENACLSTQKIEKE